MTRMLPYSLNAIVFNPERDRQSGDKSGFTHNSTNIDIGYLMNTESIVHEIGHAFDDSLDLAPSGNLVSPWEFIYYPRFDDDECKSSSTANNALRLLSPNYWSDEFPEINILYLNNAEYRVSEGDGICMVLGAPPGGTYFAYYGIGFGQRVADYTEDTFNEELEVWADMFMNWVYDDDRIQPHENLNVGFNRVEGLPGDVRAAEALRLYMELRMREYAG